MYKIIYTEKVIKDLNNIKNYISEDNILYAIKTLNSVISTIDILESFPKIGVLKTKNIRFLLEKNYKYNIVYKIEKEYIYILGVYKYKGNWE